MTRVQLLAEAQWVASHRTRQIRPLVHTRRRHQPRPLLPPPLIDINHLGGVMIHLAQHTEEYQTNTAVPLALWLSRPVRRTRQLLSRR